MMSVVTFYALFADDFRILLFPKSADLTFDVLTILAMALYLVELVLGFLAFENYLVSFYFWVDLISLLSMVPDLTLVMDGVQDSFGGGAGEGSDIAKNARATRVIKIIRIIRIIRLLRVLKIYKQVKTGQKVRNQQL